MNSFSLIIPACPCRPATAVGMPRPDGAHSRTLPRRPWRLWLAPSPRAAGMAKQRSTASAPILKPGTAASVWTPPVLEWFDTTHFGISERLRSVAPKRFIRLVSAEAPGCDRLRQARLDTGRPGPSWPRAYWLGLLGPLEAFRKQLSLSQRLVAASYPGSGKFLHRNRRARGAMRTIDLLKNVWRRDR